MLVEFLIENCRKIFGEKMAGLSSPPVEELPAPMDRSTELPLEEQCGPAGEADVEHQAKAFLDAPPSLLILQKAAGADTVMGSETAEAPVVLPPATPETTVDSLGCAEELKSPSEESRFPHQLCDCSLMWWCRNKSGRSYHLSPTMKVSCSGEDAFVDLLPL
ncbi:uncharacterized protein ACIBXB_005156 [Morphnus guianensis]